MRPWFVIGLLALVVLFPGCTRGPIGDSDQQTGPASGTSAPVPSKIPPATTGMPSPIGSIWDSRIETVNCTVAPIVFRVSQEDLRGHLPTGFEPATYEVQGFSRINLNIHDCSGAILDNLTVVSPFRFATTAAMIHANATLEEGAETHWYQFETFVENETIAELFGQIGFRVHKATISINFAAPKLDFSITVNDAAWYDGTATHYRTGPIRVSSDMRWFHTLPDQTPIWADYDEAYEIQGKFDGVVVQVQSGFLKNMKPAESGYLAAWTSQITAAGTITFGRL